MIKPFWDFVVLDIGTTEEKKTQSGIIVLDIVDQEDVPSEAVFVAKGEEAVVELKKGDKVFIRTFGWESFQEGDKRYLIGKEDNILGKL